MRALVLVAAVAWLAACAPLRPAAEAPSPPPPAAVVAPPPAVAPTPAPSRPEANERYEGQYRSAAKTSYAMLDGVLAPVEEFPDLEALRAYLRPQIDPLMRHRYPHLSEAASAAGHRVAEERHNVSVIAYIHAVKHEAGAHGDRDFHVMLGSSATTGSGIFMTAEASALPPEGDQRQRLAAVRNQLLAILGTCRCEGRFMQVSPPIQVQVTGSLFFDGAHGIGSVGPAYAKPFTVWEIHPILEIERLDAGPDESAARLPRASYESAAPATGEPEAGTSAAPPEVLEGARPPTARCRDGSLSHAKSHSGACARHGGVAEWLH
jgi:hypothetical protein